MRTWVLLCAVLAIAIAISEAAPQRGSTPRPVNPNVNLIRQGLMEKLCQRDQRLRNGGSSTTTSTTTTRSRKTRQTRRGSSSTTPASTDGPSCNNYNNYTFEQLIAENRKLLRPVNRENRRY